MPKANAKWTPGPRSHLVSQTPAQKRRTKRIIEEEEAAIPQNSAMIRQVMARMERIDQIVESLVAARRAQGMTVAEVARAANMKPSNISRLEGSVFREPNPTLNTLMAYAEAIGCDIHIALVNRESGEPIQKQADAA